MRYELSGLGSISREVTARLHLSIGGTRRAAVDHVAVVAEDARELLGDVRSAVSTASARCRLFHRCPVVFGRCHGFSDVGRYAAVGLDGRVPESVASVGSVRWRARHVERARFSFVRATRRGGGDGAPVGRTLCYGGRQTRIKDVDCSPEKWFTTAGKSDVSLGSRQSRRPFRRRSTSSTSRWGQREFSRLFRGSTRKQDLTDERDPEKCRVSTRKYDISQLIRLSFSV